LTAPGGGLGADLSELVNQAIHDAVGSLPGAVRRNATVTTKVTTNVRRGHLGADGQFVDDSPAAN
jgi:hypothetical protein